MTPIALTFTDLALAALSLIACAVLSITMSLNFHRSVAIAAARMIAQLLLVGMMLRFVIEVNEPVLMLLIVAAMLLAATFEVYSRQQTRLSGWIGIGLGGFPVIIATTLVTGLALTTALRQAAWLDARHTIPLVGIVLGTAMNCTSLALHAVLSSIARERLAIEARLSLGADRHMAFQEVKIEAARNGLIPLINQMAGAGIITLPGIMTGQILAGMDPLDAAKYQILLMLLLSGAGAAGVIFAVQLAAVALTDDRHRLRLDRLRSTG